MLSFLIPTLTLAAIVHLIVWIVKGTVQYYKHSKYLQQFDGPKPHWLFGNIRDFEFGKEIFKPIGWAEKYGPAYVVYMGPFINHIMLTTPEYIRTVMNTAEPKDPFYFILEPWIGDGLLLSKGKKWARNRKLLTPAFHFDVLKPYQKVFSKSTGVMLEKWKKSLEKDPCMSFDMFDHVSLVTLDSLMKCIFGLDGNFQEEELKNPYITAVYALSKLAIERSRFPPYFNDWIYYFSYSGYKSRQAIKVTKNYSLGVNQAKLKEKQQNRSSRSYKRYLNFLDILLDCKDDEGKGLSIREIQDEVDTFMFEGHDTTASGISWCLYNLARHPEYQEKCRKEVNEVLGDRDEVEWDDLSKLTYLTMCIKESLRIHPPVVAIGRQLTKPVELPDGRTIPAGTLIGFNINICHHNPKVWENPEIFDPERFNPRNSESRHSHAFVPFSAGPRNCIGQHFAMNEMKTVVSLVLKKFKLKLDGSRPAEPIVSLVLRSKTGIWLKVESL